MTGIPIDTFRAADSVLNGLSGPIREHMEAQLSLPASRRDLFDLATANSQLLVSISAVLVAVKTRNDAASEERMETLLDQLEKFSDLTRRLTMRLLVADEHGRVGQEQTDG